MMQLYNYSKSSASFRVRIALNLKGIDYEEIPVHLLKQGGEQFLPDYQAINPQSLVPALKDGSRVITQSLAIIEYLNDTYPTPSLLPHDAFAKAQVRAFALSIAADLHPLNNLRVLQYLTNDLQVTDSSKTAWYHHWIMKGFTALEQQLQSRHHSSDFCFGDTPSIADCFLVPQMFNARRFSCDISAFPLLTRIDAHCQKHPAFKKAWPPDV